MYITLNIGNIPKETKLTAAIRKELMSYVLECNKDALVLENAPAPINTINFMVYGKNDNTVASAAITIADDIDSEQKMIMLLQNSFRAGAASAYVFSNKAAQYAFAVRPDIVPGPSDAVCINIADLSCDIPIFLTENLVLHPSVW